MKKKMIITISILFGLLIVATIISLSIKSINLSAKSEANHISQADNNIKESDNHINQLYDIVLTKEGNIEKSLEDTYLSPLITVVEKQNDYKIKIKNIKSAREVIFINPLDGEITEFNKNKDNEFTLDIKELDTEIDYGIIVDKKLVGSVRVVDDIKNVDKEKLYKDIMYSLSCGF